MCRIDPFVAQTRVLERAGGDLNRVTRDMKAPLDALQSALRCCEPSLCTAFGRGEKCKLGDLPTALSPLPDGSGLDIIGALPIASRASELMLLEYADGLPPADVALGAAHARADCATRGGCTPSSCDLLQRTPYLARKMGSALLSKVAPR